MEPQEHKCPLCSSDLQIAKSRLTTEVGSTDIYSELDMVCIDPRCKNYSGTDLDNPKTIVETIRNKAN
jgi:hypothetical protein